MISPLLTSWEEEAARLLPCTGRGLVSSGLRIQELVRAALFCVRFARCLALGEEERGRAAAAAALLRARLEFDLERLPPLALSDCAACVMAPLDEDHVHALWLQCCLQPTLHLHPLVRALTDPALHQLHLLGTTRWVELDLPASTAALIPWQFQAPPAERLLLHDFARHAQRRRDAGEVAGDHVISALSLVRYEHADVLARRGGVPHPPLPRRGALPTSPRWRV